MLQIHAGLDTFMMLFRGLGHVIFNYVPKIKKLMRSWEFLLCVKIPAAACALRKDMRFITLINAVDANFDTL